MALTVNISFLRNLLNINTENEDELIHKIKTYYTYQNQIPVVSIHKNEVNIQFAESNLPTKADEQKFNKAVSLCNQQNWEKAESILNQLIADKPNISEYHRLLAQIHFEKNDLNKAKDILIDALKWDNKNTYALILMGNVYYYGDKDINTALEFWNQALRSDANDHISLTNIGSSLCKEGNLKEGINFLEEALQIKPNYSNALQSTALAYYHLKEMDKAFDFAIQSLKSNPEKAIAKQANDLAFTIAKDLVKSNKDAIQEDVQNFKELLEVLSDKNIVFIEDDTLPMPAKIRIAEFQNLENHEVRYKPNLTNTPHLILHELYHLKLILVARAENKNQKFTADKSNKGKFDLELEPYINKMKKKGFDDKLLKNLMQQLFDGLNSSLYNTPIDLFIEDAIYNHHEEMRPLQLLSLDALMQNYIEATTKKEVLDIMPATIIKKTKILNLVHALHLNDVFGINRIDEFKPKLSEANQAQEFYQEFKEYQDDKEPGEEYELIQHWAEDLKVDYMFNLINEDETQNKNVDEFLESITDDPFGVELYDKSQEREMKKFIKNNDTSELNMAVVMHMINALSYFKNKPKEEIKSIAFEFAKLGMSGIDPKKNNYSVPSIDKNMSGYQALSFYYITWALAIPEHLAELQLPFEKEFKLVLKMQ